MNKKTIASVLALGVIISVGYLGDSVMAHDAGPGHDQLVVKIAEKFNLKTEDVEAVFTAVHEERLEQMKKMHEEKLSEAVADGVITEAQKTLLINKFNESKVGKKRIRADMKNWLTYNGIDYEKLRRYLGKRGH